MADKEFFEATAFVPRGREGNRKPQNVGYAFEDGKGGWRLQLTAIPTGDWDGSILIQPKREQRDGAGGGYGGGQQRAAAPSGGSYAPRAQQPAPRRAEAPPPPSDDDYGPAGGGDDQDIPFAEEPCLY